jgi:plastocyanin
MRIALPVVLLLALAVAGCGSDSEEAATTGGSAGAQTIEMTASDFAFDPSAVQVDQTGSVTFRLTNDGTFPHALEIEGQGIEEATATLQPGESGEVTVDFGEEGSYVLYCPVGDHRDRGMEGELTVGAAGVGGGTGTVDEDDGTTTGDSGGYGY